MPKRKDAEGALKMELTDEDVDELRMLEESLWRAETRFDPQLMDRTFADGFIEFGRSGRRYERSEMMFEQTSDAKIEAKLPLTDYALAFIAPNVALATYTSEVRHTGTIERGRRSSLWIKNEGQWKLRFHQRTPF
ncbi:DUF4440 domain-containing protein [Falsirhodobacter sp. 1013]|uniref:nuclear transport factor 2 family protein n=1 Tax=Falsirhodobacter sp. 1013 TaxID=3417566 RepID=UPI003EC0D76F